MALSFFVSTIALAWLAAASYADLRTREVPDWLSYTLIVAGFGIAALRSIDAGSVDYLLHAAAGFAVAAALALLMFYSRQWGGGDAKLLMGLGALLGFNELTLDSFLPSLLINIFFVGAVYALFYGVYLAYRYRSRFKPLFAKALASSRGTRSAVLLFAALLFLAGFFVDSAMQLALLALAAFSLFAVWLWLFALTIERCCMLRRVRVAALTEGDWVAERVPAKGKLIAQPGQLGLTKAQLAALRALARKRRLKSVLVRVGIPFVPSFALAFVYTLLFGNMLKLLMIWL